MFVCLGLRLGLGLESGLSIGYCGNLCATLALSSLTIDTPSKLLWFDEWRICLMLAMGLFNATNLHIE